MRHKTLNGIVMAGFLLMFVATLGSLLILVMLDAIETPILQFIILPTFVIGVSLIVFEKLQTASDY